MDLKSVKIGFLGSGNIAKAIGFGIIRAELVEPSKVTICAPTDRTFPDWVKRGVKTTHDNTSLVENCDIVFLCMKPNQLEAAFENVNLSLSKPLFVSTLSGTSLKKLALVIKKRIAFMRLIRSMPNTPLLVGEGCTVLTPHETATADDISTILKIFRSIGKCEIVEERLISPVIGVAGSSPAFIFVLIEAMADAGVKGGLSREDSQKMAAQAVLGAAKMVLESGQHPAALKDAVCSPGGTTISGIEALEKAGLRAAIMSAVDASTKRSEEMTRMYE